MKNFIQISNLKFLVKNSLLRWVFLVVILTVPSFTTLLQPGYFGHHDDLQIMRIYQMDKCIKDGQIPCRWVPDMGYGYGYPLFNYYPVMPSYLGELINLMGFSLVWSVKIVFLLSLIVSGITMFLLARALWGNLGGLAASLFYVYAPYHAVDIYVRGAMAEGWSIAWAPLVFLSILLVIKNTNFKFVPLLAISIALFLMSHNPLALIFTPVMGIWALILMWQKKNFSVIKLLIIGGLWGLGLAAFFTLPVLFEAKLVHIETLFIGYFNYLAHFVSLNQLFISDFWGFGGSVWGDGDGMPFQIGKLHSVITVISVPFVAILWKKDRAKSLIVLLLISVFWGSAFLMHPRSNFIWERVTLLQNLQFPWRILSVTIFAASLLAGGLFLEVKKSFRLALAVMMIIGLFAVYQPLFKIEKQIPLTDQEKLSGALWDMQQTAGIFDYLPKTAKMPPGKRASEGIQVLEGEAKITDLRKGSNWLSFSSDSTISAKLRLPIYDYPIWKVSVDTKQVSFDNKNELGQPTFVVDSGQHQIYAKLHNTPIRTISNLLTVFSFALLIWWGRKKWLQKNKK